MSSRGESPLVNIATVAETAERIRRPSCGEERSLVGPFFPRDWTQIACGLEIRGNTGELGIRGLAA